MSDSEDDFMSDKFLVEAPVETRTYSARRSQQQLKGHRAGQAKNMQTLRELEVERRREGLNTSLFDRDLTTGTGSESKSATADGSGSGSRTSGGNKAMEMMMKMGWKVGDGLGRQRSASPESAEKRARVDDEDEAPRGGIGSASGSRATPRRAEPIRISMWAGRKGLAARSPSPPPLPKSARNPDYLDPAKLERLGREAETFRERQRADFGARDIERKSEKARELLVQFDSERGIKFHPLHATPADPLSLPRPLLKLIYPSQLAPSPTSSRSPSPVPGPAVAVASFPREKNVSAAERLRDQMRRDMLSELGEDEETVRFSVQAPKPPEVEPEDEVKSGDAADGESNAAPVDWESMVSGTKRVLSMSQDEYFAFLLSQLRNEYLFCFWCAYRYKTWDELEGPGGCPGEDEDDH